jgi:hypothetical protein
VSRQSLWRRYRDALVDTRPPQDMAAVGRDGYTLWQSYWTNLVGIRLPARDPGGPGDARLAPAGDPARHRMPGQSAQPEAIRLPRFDRAALRTAGTPSLRRQSQEMVAAGLRCILRDAGGDRLEIIVESGSETVGAAALVVTVTTPDRSLDYLLLFTPEAPRTWVAALQAPGIRGWADVSIRGGRELSSLGPGDADAVRRSVRAVPDPWVSAWLAVAQTRAAGDPVREAIERSL